MFPHASVFFLPASGNTFLTSLPVYTMASSRSFGFHHHQGSKPKLYCLGFCYNTRFLVSKPLKTSSSYPQLRKKLAHPRQLKTTMTSFARDSAAWARLGEGSSSLLPVAPAGAFLIAFLLECQFECVSPSCLFILCLCAMFQIISLCSNLPIFPIASGLLLNPRIKFSISGVVQ